MNNALEGITDNMAIVIRYTVRPISTAYPCYNIQIRAQIVQFVRGDRSIGRTTFTAGFCTSFINALHYRIVHVFSFVSRRTNTLVMFYICKYVYNIVFLHTSYIDSGGPSKKTLDELTATNNNNIRGVYIQTKFRLFRNIQVYINILILSCALRDQQQKFVLLLVFRLVCGYTHERNDHPRAVVRLPKFSYLLLNLPKLFVIFNC